MKRILIFGILLSLCVFQQLVSQTPPQILASIPPGTSSAPLLVRFSIPFGTRLSLRINDDPVIDYSKPILLTTQENTEQTFFVQARLYPLDPEKQILEEKLFYWKIDRKPPSSPQFSIYETEVGSIVSIAIDEPGTIEYRIFHSVSGSTGTGTTLSHESFFIPHGSSLVAWGIDSSGNIGPASAPSPSDLVFNNNPFTIVNPVSGTWSNTQVLLIESAPGVEIYYSVNENEVSIFGQKYTEPVVLEHEGVVALRVLAIDSEGKEFIKQVLYTVTPKLYPELGSIETASSFLEFGEFGEFAIPSKYSYEIGGVDPYFTGDTSLVFSGIRDVHTYYPLTLSDTTNSWRWICTSGFKSSPENPSEKIEKTVPKLPLEPKINDWNYISFDLLFDVFYSLDKQTWKKYVEPIFITRTENTQLYWYSSSLKKGEVQILSLPARPDLTGLPVSSTTSDSVYLGVTDSPYTFYVEIGGLYFPEKPSVRSSRLSNGLLFEIPSQAETSFKVRVLAVYEDIPHGELYTSFSIDRKPPRVPSSGVKKDVSFSRQEIRFLPRGEDTLNVSITPPLFKIEKGTYILTGDTDRPIDYEVSIFSQDAAGNTSDSITFAPRIDLNAIFINSQSTNTVLADGTPSAPFTDLDSALDLIGGSGSWRIYIQGSPVLLQKHTIDSHVSFFGTGGEILFHAEASLTFLSSFVSMENIDIIQDTRLSIPQTLYPLTRDGFSLIEFHNSTFKASNTEFKRTNQFSGALISAIQTNIECNNSAFSMQAIEYAQVFYLEKSSLTAQLCTFSAIARDVSALAVANSSVYLTNAIISVEAENSGRAIEAWDSKLNLASGSFNGRGKKRSLPTAVWIDEKSSLIEQENIQFSGFDSFSKRNVSNK